MNRKPNIVYILADDMGYGDVSALNPNAAFETPNFDAMAQNGVVFTDAHASSAVCTPSRYSILTGRYNWRSQLKSGVIGGFSPPLIEQGRTTVADLLKEQGYQTAAFGKWHLGMDFAKTADFVELEGFAHSPGVDYSGPIQNGPNACGFDYFFGISASLDMPPYAYIENDRFTAAPDPDRVARGEGKEFFREGPCAPDFDHEEVLDVLTDRVLDTLEELQDGPFFLYFALPAPHTPIFPAPAFRGKSGTNAYGDFVLHCDDVVGRVRRKLKKLGIAENTLLIYTSDNGCSPMADFDELKAHGHNPSYLFRGMKADIYEGGHRVPLLMEWPEAMPQGERCDRLVCLSDLMATLADLLEIRLLDNQGEDSVSILPLMRKPQADEVRRDLVHQSIDGSLSLRRGCFKLALCPGSGGWSSPRPGEEAPDALCFQLFNLAEDVAEQKNLLDQYPDMVQEMKQTLMNYLIRGRSTAGAPQENQGEAIWQAIAWAEQAEQAVDGKTAP
ncbi:MAG: arylsulfatase [Bacillota bacterium]|nr:arylsulfatase [Bacillota bacterium]